MRLLRFHATWCQPCKRFEPIIRAFADKHGIPLVDIDIEERAADADSYSVMTVPTTILIKDDQPVATINGAVPTPVLESRLREYL